jgi:Cu-Zn family superoxide dismutase
MNQRQTTRITLISLATATVVGAPTALATNSYSPPNLPTSYALPTGGVYPEGIAYDRDSGEFYVTSVATGAVFRGSLTEPSLTEFLPAGGDGRTNAVGIKTDGEGRVFVAGGSTGKVWIYDADSGDLLHTFDNGSAGKTFLNDLAITPKGDVYVTDSSAPTLWKIPADAYEDDDAPQTGTLVATPLGAPYAQSDGFNANGIVSTKSGRYLLVVQSDTGKLYRYATDGGQVKEVALTGGTLANGDGLELVGHRLYAIRNSDKLLVTVRLGERFAQGSILSAKTDPSFAFPTTLAITRVGALVVNSQFDRGGPAGPGTPELPFKVSRVSLR